MSLDDIEEISKGSNPGYKQFDLDPLTPDQISMILMRVKTSNFTTHEAMTSYELDQIRKKLIRLEPAVKPDYITSFKKKLSRKKTT